jgi:hypothetical protein
VGVSVLPDAGCGIMRDSIGEALGGRHVSDGSNRCVRAAGVGIVVL